MGQVAAKPQTLPAVSMQPAWEVSRALAVAFVHLEALERTTLAGLTIPLTTPQYHALAALADAPHESLGSLADRLLCDKANASGIVDRLEAMGLVTRIRATSDRRRVSLSPTSLGIEILAEATASRADTLHRALAPVRGELAAVLRHLNRLAESLEIAQRGKKIAFTPGETP